MTEAKYPEEMVVCLECNCATTFEPDNIVVDRYGERWAICPNCKCQIRLAAKD